MNQLNSLIIEGNVSRAVVIHNEGIPNADFEIGEKRQYRNRSGELVEEVEFFTIVCFGNLAEICNEKTKLERGIIVVGRLKQENWKDND